MDELQLLLLVVNCEFWTEALAEFRLDLTRAYSPIQSKHSVKFLLQPISLIITFIEKRLYRLIEKRPGHQLEKDTTFSKK